MTEENKLLGVDEVAKLIGVSRSYAYRVIRRLNAELTEAGRYVVPGKVNKAFLEAKYFDLPDKQNDEEVI